MLVVVTYTKRMKCQWQIIETNGTVISVHSTRSAALNALAEMKNEIN